MSAAPQVITTASSFNVSLWSLIGSAVATEARAFANVNHTGLTFWRVPPAVSRSIVPLPCASAVTLR